MKKLIASLILILLFAPLAQAATIISEHTNNLTQNYLEELVPLAITAENDGEITAEHGINIMLDKYKYLLWNDNEVNASGSAVENERVSATFTPEFLDDYKILHIPVASDWESGETLTLTGLKIRTYNREIGKRYLELDINGDKIADAYDINAYQVSDVVHTDTTPPYPVADIEYSVNEDKTAISFTWKNPPDYDLISNTIERTLTRDDYIYPPIEILSAILDEKLTDSDIQPTDQVTYRIFVRDRRNYSEAVEISVDLATYTPPVAGEEEVAEEEELVEEEEDPEMDEELESLDSLFNYYKIRHSIICGRSTGSDCLLAKTNLIYAQEKLDRSDVDISLSERDLYLMRLRIKWPEQRYQTKCIEAETPDKTCTALEKALKQVHYFIDEE